MLIASQINIAEMAKWTTARPHFEVWITAQGCLGSVLQGEKAQRIRRAARRGPTGKLSSATNRFQD
ncbi:hypothetical protein SE92_16695 [Bradyrhizobium sp. AT1]|nr:hypothetical protein SE92_16695 [Bradyrhizobium sp. AT1]